MYRLIGAPELKERLEAGDDLPLVDLRDEEAFTRGHLAGARWIPAGEMVGRWIPQHYPTGGPLVLYDGGGDERIAAGEAARLGHLWFQAVLVLQGGIETWREAGLPLEEGAPLDPLGVGRPMESMRPPAGIIPAAYAPRRGPDG